VRHLSESYGIDPESLLMSESIGASAGSSTVLRKGARGIRVSVEESHQAAGSSRPDSSSDTTDDSSQQLTTPTTTVVSPSSQMPSVVLPERQTPRSRNLNRRSMTMYEQPQLSEEQKMANILNKLQKLTGRKMSLEEISPLLRARNADEAKRNGRMLRTAEHLKRVYGGRPENYVCVTTVPAPAPAPAPPAAAAAPAAAGNGDDADTGQGGEKSSPTRSHHHQHPHHAEEQDAAEPMPISRKDRARLRKKKSRSVFDFTSLRPIDGEEDDEAVPQQTSRTTELVNETTFGLKIEKLSRLTGRRSSLSEIRGLLLPSNPEEAKRCAQSLYTVEKLKKRYGERPSMDQTPQPQQQQS